jgi:hypothetical protein
MRVVHRPFSTLLDATHSAASGERVIGGNVSLAIGLLVLSLGAPAGKATVLSFTGDLRTDANIVTCQGAPCVPPLSTDFDYAQFAAFVATFNVASPSAVEAITFSYGGGTNGNGAAIAPTASNRI